MFKKISAIVLPALMLLGVLLLAAPDAFAQGTPPPAASTCQAPTDIGKLFKYAICTLTTYVIPFLFALALVIFIAGIIKYVKSGDNEESRQAGRGLMLFGIIALFVMTATWGLVEIIYNSIFGGTSHSEFKMPGLPAQSPPFER